MEEKYNGYTNYETWKLCLNLDNDFTLYNLFKDYKGDAEELKIELQDMFITHTIGGNFAGYKIVDYFPESDWEKINWEEVLETRKGDE